MRARAVVLAVAIVLAPLGARAADLVVWWDKGYYPQEDEAVREIIAAFEQKTGKQVELVLPRTGRAFRTRSRRRSRPASRPTSRSARHLATTSRQWAFDDRLVDLTDTVGPSRTCSIRTCSTLRPVLNARPGRRACTGCRWAARPTTSTSGRASWSRRASRSTTFPRSGTRSGRSGATRCSRRCARPSGRDDIWGVGLPMSVAAATDTDDEFLQFVAAYEADYVTRDGRLVIDDPEVRRKLIRAHRQLHGHLPQGLHAARIR